MISLSIIVPVYNKENYVDECIQSILNQTVRDFELILVNDGSTDGSLEKCLKHEKLDNRVTVIDQKNRGVSSARNTGVKQAKGSYIGFVDSDDTIEPDMYEVLIKNALAYDADVSVCRMRAIFPYKSYNPEESTGITIYTAKDALGQCLKGRFDMNANNKIYRREIAQQVNFEGRINEDILYICRIFVITKKSTVIEDVVKYNYILRDNSVSMSKFNIKYMEMASVAEKVTKLVAENNEECLPDAKTLAVTANLSLLNLLLLADKKTFKNQYAEVVENLRSHSAFISNSENVRKKHKYAVKMFFAWPWLYKWCMYFYCVLTQSEVIKRS